MGRFSDFMDRKRREHERILIRREKLGSPTTWRMKLRVRIVTRLNCDQREIKTSFRGRRILIRSRTKGQVLKDADWIVFIARRFSSVEKAARFGFDLQSAVSVIAAIRSFPVDVGFDNTATTTFGAFVKDAVAKEGHWLIDDVHGVDVYPDTQTVMVSAGEARVTTATSPERITAPLETLGKALGNLDDRVREASLLMNAAHMASHPVAALALSIAAVELLSASERWNEAQKAWIKGVYAHLDTSGLSENEKAEMRHAINGMYNAGALSRSRRMFSDLGLDHLIADWENLYQRRSRLFHGDRIVPGADVQAMGSDAKRFGQSILRAYVQRNTGVEDDELMGDGR